MKFLNVLDGLIQKKESYAIPLEITTIGRYANESCISTEASPTSSNIDSIEMKSTKEQSFVASARIKKNHQTSSIIGDINVGITTRKKNKLDYAKMIANVCFTSTVEPTNVTKALNDEQWIKAMREELLHSERNQVWKLISKPSNANIIGTKCIFKNKTNEKGNVIKIKLVLWLKDMLRLRELAGSYSNVAWYCCCDTNHVIPNGCQKCIP